MKQVAVVILNWNGKKLMEQFLPSLIRYTPENIADLIVADNASSDDSLEFLQKNYPQIQIIKLEKNYGFAEGYNQAFSRIENEYAVLLNSDVEVTENWLFNMLNYVKDNPEVIAVQPKILSFGDKSSFEYAGACGGYIDYYGYPFCRGRILNTIEKDTGQYNNITQILWASGACLFISLKEYKEAGGLDTHFFAHQEEIDLCWRLSNRGKKIIVFPSSVVYHVGGGTLEMDHPRKIFLNFRNNLLTLYKNMPEESLGKIMFFRFFLDMLSAVNYILKGKFSNAKAVLSARKAFHRMKKDYVNTRKDNLEKTSVPTSSLLYQKSILWEYYVKKRRFFSHISH